jgi:hypothetical protein
MTGGYGFRRARLDSYLHCSENFSLTMEMAVLTVVIVVIPFSNPTKSLFRKAPPLEKGGLEGIFMLRAARPGHGGLAQE